MIKRLPKQPRELPSAVITEGEMNELLDRLGIEPSKVYDAVEPTLLRAMKAMMDRIEAIESGK